MQLPSKRALKKAKERDVKNYRRSKQGSPLKRGRMRMPARFCKDALSVESPMDFGADARRSKPGFIGIPLNSKEPSHAVPGEVQEGSAASAPLYDKDLVDGWDSEIRDLVLNKGFHYVRNSECVSSSVPVPPR